LLLKAAELLVNLESFKLGDVLRHFLAQFAFHEAHLEVVDVRIHIDTLLSIVEVPLGAFKLVDLLPDLSFIVRALLTLSRNVEVFAKRIVIDWPYVV